MVSSKKIIDQIEADKHNIQVLIDMLPHEKKTRYNQIQAQIKKLVKEIKYQKDLIQDKVFSGHETKSIPLFEIEPSEIEQVDIDSMSSFFGLIE